MDLVRSRLLIHSCCQYCSNDFFLSTNFPFFSATDDRWKNSIRHNLSLYPEFVKGVKSEENTGHLWHLDMDLMENASAPLLRLVSV